MKKCTHWSPFVTNFHLLVCSNNCNKAKVKCILLYAFIIDVITLTAILWSFPIDGKSPLWNRPDSIVSSFECHSPPVSSNPLKLDLFYEAPLHSNPDVISFRRHHYSNRRLDIRTWHRQEDSPANNNSRKCVCIPCDAAAWAVHCSIRIWYLSSISVSIFRVDQLHCSCPLRIEPLCGISVSRNGSLSAAANSQEAPETARIHLLSEHKTKVELCPIVHTINPPQINSRVMWL